MIKLIEILSSPFKINKLKKQYRMLYGPNKQEAERSLGRQMAFIKTKYPDKSEKWHLEKIIYDLKRDRR